MNFKHFFRKASKAQAVAKAKAKDARKPLVRVARIQAEPDGVKVKRFAAILPSGVNFDVIELGHHKELPKRKLYGRSGDETKAEAIFAYKAKYHRWPTTIYHVVTPTASNWFMRLPVRVKLNN